MSFEAKIGHLENVESPWGNAGGVVKTLEDVAVMAQTGVGWIEAGSYTLEPRQGNAYDSATGQHDKTVYYHDPITGETFNSLGMPNKGMDVVETEIPDMVNITHSYSKYLAVNIAPVSDAPVTESIELARRAYDAGADTVILNAGCPNVITEDEERHEILSRNPLAFTAVLQGLAYISLPKSIWVRISPQETYADMRGIIEPVKLSGIVSAVLTPNTWPGHVPRGKQGKPILEVPGGSGGLSGPATSPESFKQTLWAVNALKGSEIDVISSGGIIHAHELERRLKIGAVAAAGTTFFYESRNGWKEDVDRLLTELAN